MNLIEIKTGLFLLLMIVFLVTAFIAKDEVNIHISSSIAIITGALVLKSLSPKNYKK
jgi:hypothetical protein